MARLTLLVGEIQISKYKVKVTRSSFKGVELVRTSVSTPITKRLDQVVTSYAFKVEATLLEVSLSNRLTMAKVELISNI